MALVVHLGSQLGPLADGLVARLAEPGGDPFAAPVVAVPTAGVRDWLTRRLAADLGIAANIAMPYPGAFLAAALGLGDEDDPWEVERLTWAVLDVLDGGAVDVPGRGEEGSARPRYAVARRIADLYDRYASNRPEILRQWANGAPGDGTVRSTVAGGGSTPGDLTTVGTLPQSMHWQFDLWRHVRRRIGTPSPAEVTGQRLDQLRAGVLRPALPEGVEIFGLSAVSPSQLAVLDALGAVGGVHLSLLHPSPPAWSATRPVDHRTPTPRSRVDGEIGARDGHPLLRSWGRRSSETAALVRGLDADVVDRSPPVGSPPATSPTTTLLEHVRADLATDRPPTPFTWSPADTSLQVHACHGTIRQLEVLRDVLGHLFVADPSLRPDDALVICPDLARFEPFAAAVFGRGALPVPLTVSDLTLGTENAVVDALATIVRTIAGRCAAADVLAVAALAPVRRRLGITADDLDRFARWTDRLGTSWGLDGEHRRTWLNVDVELGSWEQALRSLLVGAAIPAPEPRVVLGGTAPFDDVGGDDVPAAGRLAELVARLRHVCGRATGRRAVGDWCDVLDDITASLCATAPSDAWQEAEVYAVIEQLRTAGTVAGERSATALDFEDVRAIVDGIAGDRRGRLRLRTGRVALTGHAPVGNVPAKVICLLGFDESALGPAGLDGDDLLGVRPCVGERDRQEGRRRVLLDAIFAAERTLIIMCDGNDVTTNHRIRFTVQLDELLDVVRTTIGGGRDGDDDDGHDDDDGDPPIVVRHSLRAHDERNFDLATSGSSPSVPSFDDVMCRAAELRAQRTDRSVHERRRRWRLDAAVPEDVVLRQLVDACVCPAQTLLREALGVRLPAEAEPIDQRIPLAVSKLGAASIGQRLLERYHRHAALPPIADDAGSWDDTAVVATDTWRSEERLAATAPPGSLIDETLDRVAGEVDALVAAAECCGLDRRAVLAASEVIEVDVELATTGRLTDHPLAIPGHLRLADRVVGIADGVVVRLGYRRPRPRAIVAAALDLAAVVLATGGSARRALTVTRVQRGFGAPECHLFEVTADDPVSAARRLLEVAAELRVAAFRGAVPVFERTTRQLFDDGFIDEEVLIGNDFRRGDLDEPSNHFLWGDVTVAELGSLQPAPLELAVALWGAIAALMSITKVGSSSPPGSGG